MGNNNLYLSDERYLVALERQKGRIEEGLELDLDDSNETGNKHTHCSWGLCSEDKEAWPDAEDHLWPDQFKKEGRVAPKYHDMGRQPCPFDARTSAQRNKGFVNGCFFTCRFFRPRGQEQPDRGEALHLYDVAIDRVKRRLKLL